VNIGIGLPAMIPGVDRDSLLDWARRAEDRGFSSLGTLDRLVYENFEPLVALAAAAAVTERIRLTTDILIAPLRGNGAVLAKQAATIDALSNGRLTLGVGVGLREDDFKVAGVPFEERGGLFDQQLDEMKRVWAGEERGFAGPVGPPPGRDGGPELVIGGSVDATIERVVRFGDGWTMGGGPPDAFKEMSGRIKEAWSEAGRDGTPRLIALCYFALGEGAAEVAEHDLSHYYGWLGDEMVGQIVGSAVTDEGTAQGYRDAFADAGADELIYFPTSTDPGQVDLLADALL
jgi:alkanesulfonate monooxygenase SsuD/methylene tetrahydromethanopterin reductase-like flavin-dependent oxidoreductase (luciferase family)